jgi:photosystem II stability/assembly factor-like uncharacterized protein
VAVDPVNPRNVFAGFWQMRRRPWEMVSGGPGSGLAVSHDGGDTWTWLTGDGLPDGIWGKVGVAVAPSDPRRVYALIEAEEGGLFRSDDGGKTWTCASDHGALRQRAWYYSTLTVDPKNPEVVWFPQVPLLKTSDGGKTIKRVKGPHHGDHHDIWIDPTNPRRILNANDGGVDVSSDGGETWYAAPLVISQFYHVSVDTSVPYRVSGAMQDLGTASGPSNSLSSAGITLADWHGVGGGEAGYTAHDSSDPNVVYAGEYLGILTRYDHRTRQARYVGPWPEYTSGWGAEHPQHRIQWTAPITVSPHDPKTVYHGANVLFRTRDDGQTWEAISPDLTRDDESKQRWSGGPITGDNTGVEYYCTIFAIAESPLEKGVLWVGSDDGLVHVSRDDGATWTNVTANVPGLPEWGTVSIIEPSPFDAGTAYLVVDNHRMDDPRPYLWKTADYGATWASLTTGLPDDIYLHAVREDPKRQGLLYAGTERGVAFSLDDGASWIQLKLNLPTVAVHDLVVKDDDLVVGTHGRSIWILDDLTPLREWTEEVETQAVHLFPVRPTTRWSYHSGISAHLKGPGENPPAGALVYYWLKEKPGGEFTIEFLDEGGAVIRRLSSEKVESDYAEDDPDPDRRLRPPEPLPAEAGVQRAVWDLRYEGAKQIAGAEIDFGDPYTGPLVLPGTYTVRLTVGEETHTASLEVGPDPRAKTSRADLEEQLAFALGLRDDLTRIAEIVAGVRAVREGLATRAKLLEGNAAAAELVKDATALGEKLDTLESKLHNPEARVNYDILGGRSGGVKLHSKLSPLYSWAHDGDGAPTEPVREIYRRLATELEALDAEWAAILETDLPALNAKARGLALEFVPAP